MMDRENVLYSGRLHALVALILCLGFLMALLYARYLAQDAIVRFGKNVDSGAYLSAFSWLFLLPGAALFAIAALSLLRGWRAGRYLHWLALAWLGLPVLLLLVAEGRRYIGA